MCAWSLGLGALGHSGRRWISMWKLIAKARWQPTSHGTPLRVPLI